MSGGNSFTHINPELLPVFDELRIREPIFHTRAFGRTAEEFARAMAPGFWEVGASGRCYSREEILALAIKTPEHFVDASEAGWRTQDYGLLQLGPGTYLLTYTLDQNGRISRRSTLWRREQDCWKIVYHQGTIVSAQAATQPAE